ncbi:MAG: hypothetical protein JWM59_4753 [Verrucomicrobiales bacterium]|nr:hypothetical protein [Verrucomicrobiales bacterium]
MDKLIDLFSKPFVWGLCLGLLFFVLSAWSHFKTKRELRRYRKHLSDKLELEARQYEIVRREKEAVAKENENLRLRIGQLNEKPEQKMLRDLEVLSRAEKRMTLQAPGFAAAWETAKAAAIEELTVEDQGRSLPKRIFTRLFGNSTVTQQGDTALLTGGAQPVIPGEPEPLNSNTGEKPPI